MIKISTVTIKTIIFVIALIPFMIMLWKTINEDLGANPVEKLSQLSGLWSLRFLLITLAISPLRMLFKKPGINKYRRMLGLFTFFYCTLHFLIFIVLEHSLNLNYILEDILTSITIDIGLLAYILLIPLALTSTNSMVRRLGKTWKKLHISVYVIAMMSIIHFTFSEKADIRSPLIYGALLLGLFIIRGVKKNQNRQIVN